VQIGTRRLRDIDQRFNVFFLYIDLEVKFYSVFMDTAMRLRRKNEPVTIDFNINHRPATIRKIVKNLKIVTLSMDV